MAKDTQRALSDFTRDALSAGRSRDDIARALTAAGWSDSEAATALAQWADDPIGLPVPRPHRSVSAAEAFFYGLMFLSLGAMSVYAVQLGFYLIDVWIPDPLDPDPSRYQTRGMRRAIAGLIVFAPLFFWLNTRSLRATRADPGKRLSPVRRWLTYLALLCGAMVLLGDLIWLIYSVLNGDLTVQVIAKAGVLAAVAGTVLYSFRVETREGVDAA